MKRYGNDSGYSIRNLKYMRQFAVEYPDFPFVQVPLAQIIWYHHISMYPKVKDNILRAFYIPNNFADTLPPLKLPFMNSCNMHIIIQRRLLSCAISKRLWRYTNTRNKRLHCNFESGMNTKYLMSSCLSGF